MKGLLIKDLRFAKGQRTSLFIFVGLFLFFLLTKGDINFAIWYTMMFVAILSTSSITYDSMDNGMPFLLTLPIQKKSYVASRYIFSGLCILVMGTLMGLLVVGCDTLGIVSIDWSNIVDDLLMGAFIAVIILVVMIPVYVIFGAEKARTVVIILFGACFVIGFLISEFAGDKLAKALELLAKLRNMGEVPFALLAMGVMVVLLIISMVISMIGLEKKEY